MTDNNIAPVDLRIKRKYNGIDDEKISTRKKSRHRDNEIPLDLSLKSHQHTSSYPISAIPFYNPANLFLNSSALLYDLFLANLNSYCQQQQQQQQRIHQQTKVESVKSKSIKQQSITSNRSIKDHKHESYACSCGERYSSVAKLVSHLKITNHSAKLSSTHDEVAKLVRGQDIWLSRDTNPANQILKCLRCSLSFETLPDLTAHMMKTNHFTQLLSPSANSYQHSNSKISQTLPSQQQQQQQQQQHLVSPKLSNINSRSTCLVCSKQFSNEIDLVDHLQHLHQIRFNCTTCGMYFENESIYKEHLIKEMHHRNAKTSKNRDYFIQQSKLLQKRPILNHKIESQKAQPYIDEEVVRLMSDLVDRIVLQSEITSSNALSLLQNFVIRETTSTTLVNKQIDLNNNCDVENSKETMKNLSNEKSWESSHTELNENPLASLEKMLAYSTVTIESPSTSINDCGLKTKKFDKYRLFAEKMIRSTMS